MRMSRDNTSPEYRLLSTALTQQSVGLTAAEMHGLISGMLCGGNKDNSWKTLLHDLTNEGIAFPATLSQELQNVYDNVRSALEEDDFTFSLLLPDDDDSTVFDRADALSGWVNHFLLGLGMIQPKLGQVKGETGEAIDDLRNIAQLGYEEDEDQNELEQSLEEVIEYVRVAAVLCYTEFTAHKPTAPENIKPTLH